MGNYLEERSWKKYKIYYTIGKYKKKYVIECDGVDLSKERSLKYLLDYLTKNVEVVEIKELIDKQSQE